MSIVAICDLETTGTDEYRDHILEVGVAVVSSDLDMRELDAYESVIQPPDGWQDRMPAQVREMHQKNGLLAELEEGAGVPLHQADADVTEMLKSYGAGEDKAVRIPLGGSGVGHFDARFIHAQMPRFSKLLTYWVLDSGVMRRFIRQCGREDLLHPESEGKNRSHRALDDALAHLAEFRTYARHFNAVPTPGQQSMDLEISDPKQFRRW